MRKMILVCLLIALNFLTDPVAEATLINGLSIRMMLSNGTLERGAIIMLKTLPVARQARAMSPSRHIFKIDKGGDLAIRHVLVGMLVVPAGGLPRGWAMVADRGPLRPLYQYCQRPAANPLRRRLASWLPEDEQAAWRLTWRRCIVNLG